MPRGWRSIWLAIAASSALAACDVRPPPEQASTDPAPPEASQAPPSLLGGPARGAVETGSDGFVLVGGPLSRPVHAARRDDAADGFQLAAADDVGAAHPDPVAVDPAASAPPGPEPAAPDWPRHRLAIGPRTLAATPVRQGRPPARKAEPLKALALLTDGTLPADPPPQPTRPPAASVPSPIDLSRTVLFLAVVAAAALFWGWHKRCQRAMTARWASGP